MLFASSFDESRGNSCICLYTASKASSLYDQVLEYAFDTYNVKIKVPTEIQKHNSMIFPWFSMNNKVISMTI